MTENLYNGDIVAGSLLVNESRKVADVLLQGHDEKTFYEKLIVGNLLQKRSPATARRQAKLIRNRLLPLHSDYWIIVRDGSQEQATQALLAAAVIHSRLLGDFIKYVVGMKIRTYQKQLTSRDWDNFFDECKLREPSVAQWAETTTKKIRQVVFRILAEAKVIDSTKSMNILPFSLLPEITDVLDRHGQHYALGCLEVLQ